MITARISTRLPEEWLAVPRVVVGEPPSGSGTPTRYVTLDDGGNGILQVDVYQRNSEASEFEQVAVWDGILVIGFGAHVHLVWIDSGRSVSHPLGSYFSRIYLTTHYLLIASGERLFRLEPDGSILWKSAQIAVDGVVVNDPGPPIIRGDAELDPPGGWQPFEMRAADGSTRA